MFDTLKRSIIGKVLDKIDKAGLARWPVGWIKVRRALVGWKTVLGAIVFATPDILAWASNALPGMLPAIGVEDATPILHAIGSTLIFIGMVHKFLKFSEPVERRQDARMAEVVSTVAVLAEAPKDASHVRVEGEATLVPPGVYTKTELDAKIRKAVKE